MKILVLNSGSSSQKSCLYELSAPLPDSPPAPMWEGKVEWQGNRAVLEVRNSAGITHRDEMTIGARPAATARLLDAFVSGKARVLTAESEIAAVGHRIVNGGREYTQPTVVTADVKAAIERMGVFAPLHNRVELEGINLIEKQLGPIPQIAVFDTAFHSRLPAAAVVYPGPYEWVAQGIRRYGFHGINHQYCAERTAQLLATDLLALKLVTCHLGNGCSLAAIQNGQSIDTTMGFTPLEGLMMGTRSGSIDPGILTYLMRERHLTGQELDELLNTKSGLLGISGVSGDMRQVVSAMKDGNPRAKLAFDIFVHRLQAGIGSMIGALGGIDALVFTAGIGENSPEVREVACANFGFLGLTLDSLKNASPQPDQDISAARSSVRVFVLRAQEDWAIARECWKLVSSPGQPGARIGEEQEQMKTDFKSVDEYIASQPDGVQSVLNRVRSTIRKAVPAAEETITYKIPAYKLHGDRVLFFAGWKQHYSLYPATERVIEAFKDDLAPYEVSKGTIRFPLSEPVPVKLIGRIAKFRAKEVSEREKAKAAAPRRG